MIDHLIQQQHSFALYRLPEQSQPKLVLSTEDQVHLLQSIDDLVAQRGFLMLPFAIEQSPIVLLQSTQIIEGWDAIRAKIITSCDAKVNVATYPVVTDECKETEWNDYRQMFQSCMQALMEQRCQKVVLSRTKQLVIPKQFNYQQLFEQACHRYSNAFVYLCYTPQTGIWFGASPERFLSGVAQQWQTVALAGTQRVLVEPTQLKWDAKNRLEQQIVVDYIRDCLLEVVNELQQSQPYTVQAGALYHLKTDFNFKCETSQQIIDLIKALHPTPAVCGFPKQQAYTLLRQHERHARDYYSGIVGWFDFKQRTDLYVNLRCFSQSNDRLRLFSGGGLLQDSNMYDEWQETEAKLHTMLTLLEGKD